jgi:hypothetical protein
MSFIFKTLNEYLNHSKYIYHGTSKGATLRIQRDGYMKPNSTGEVEPSISFTSDLHYAEYFANVKGGSNPSILRTLLTDDFILSPRIRNNKGDEYVTFKSIPVSELEVFYNGEWKSLVTWNVIFNEPL